MERKKRRAGLIQFATIAAAVLITGAMAGAQSDRASEIRDVVVKANHAWIRAARTLQDAHLGEVFADDALADHQEALAMGRKEGFYIEADLVSLEVEGVEFASDGTSARIHTREHWKSTSRRVGTGECILSLILRDNWQVYRLRQIDGTWRVVGLDKDTGNPKPERQPCPQE